jgi:hypothetical protein
VLEHLHDLLGRRVRQRDDFADASVLRGLERGNDVPKLERQTPQMTRADFLVRRRDEDDGRATVRGRSRW